MTELVTIANQQFRLPEGLEFRDFQGHPHTYAIIDSKKIDKSNPLGIVDSIDANTIRSNSDNSLKKFLQRNGAQPVPARP